MLKRSSKRFLLKNVPYPTWISSKRKKQVSVVQLEFAPRQSVKGSPLPGLRNKNEKRIPKRPFSNYKQRPKKKKKKKKFSKTNQINQKTYMKPLKANIGMCQSSTGFLGFLASLSSPTDFQKKSSKLCKAPKKNSLLYKKNMASISLKQNN